jgi:hypothetical protein
MVPYYYVRTQEKCEIALLDMFNNIKVNKYTDLDRVNYTKTIRVPIVINQDKNFANWFRSVDYKKRAMPIPIGGLRYLNKQENSNNRTQATYARSIFSRATDQWIRDIQPTPYYLFYELEFLTDSKSDFGQITENIVPYFNTTRTLRIKEFDFAPDIERKIPVFLQSVTDTFEDELEARANHRFIKTKFLFRLEVDWYRPFEMPEMIKYAEMNFRIEDFLHKQQIFVYPDPIAQIEKKAWEQLDPSTRTGFTLLKTMAKTLIKQVDLDGNISWEDITVPDADRPTEVPSFNLLHLNFDDDTPLEDDQSGFNRDFVALNDSTREFVPDMPPITITNLPFNDGSVNITTNTITVGDNSRNTYVAKNVIRFTSTGTLPSGLVTETDYIINTATSTGDSDTITLFENDGVTPVDIITTSDSTAIHNLAKIGDAGSNIEDGYSSSSSWNKILDWFGTDNGLHESPYTFQSILQFKDDPVPDTIFQYLSNDEVLDDNGGVLIPEGEVFFDWGIINSKPYFSFKTYGDDALFYTFTTKNKLLLNNTDIYKFVFVSYDQGHAGMFGYTINDGAMIALETERD